MKLIFGSILLFCSLVWSDSCDVIVLNAGKLEQRAVMIDLSKYVYDEKHLFINYGLDDWLECTDVQWLPNGCFVNDHNFQYGRRLKIAIVECNHGQ